MKRILISKNSLSNSSFIYSWYSDTGNLDIIRKEMVNDLLHWREKYPNKPVMVTEYGADTISGE